MTSRSRIFGRVLESAVPLPELLPAPAHDLPDWHFAVRTALPPMRESRALGDDLIYGDVHARLLAHADGHRIVVDDTGTFDLSADRRVVTWEARADARQEFVRGHLIGRVLATALFLDGMLPLHGSAVRTAEGVIAFLAPKGHGKSSLALALATAGAELATDDTLPVRTDVRRPQAWPGVQSVRAHDDTLGVLGAAAPADETPEGKRLVTGHPGLRRMGSPHALAAVYLLAPVEPLATPPDGGPAVPAPIALEPMPQPLAAVAVLAHVKIGRMLGPAFAEEMLRRATALTSAVPVRRLLLPRDLGRLDAAARELLAWHGGAP